MKLKSQSGFSHIALLMLLIVIGCVGFAGWKVYKTALIDRHDKPYSQTTKETLPLPVTQQPLSEGWVEYTNNELGFKFAYPKEWGDAVTNEHKESKQAGGFKGEWSTIRFNSNPKVTLESVSKDYQMLGGRDGGNCAGDLIYGRIMQPGQITDQGKFQANADGVMTYHSRLSEGNDYYIDELYEYYPPTYPGGVGICPGFTLSGAKIFSEKNKMSGLAFDWNQYAENCCSTWPTEAEYKAFAVDKNAVLSAAEKAKAVEVIKSIREL